MRSCQRQTRQRQRQAQPSEPPPLFSLLLGSRVLAQTLSTLDCFLSPKSPHQPTTPTLLTSCSLPSSLPTQNQVRSRDRDSSCRWLARSPIAVSRPACQATSPLAVILLRLPNVARRRRCDDPAAAPCEAQSASQARLRQLSSPPASYRLVAPSALLVAACCCPCRVPVASVSTGPPHKAFAIVSFSRHNPFG